MASEAPPDINPDDFETPFTPEQMEAYLLAVYIGAITKDSLSLEYYTAIIKKLEEAMVIGYQSSLDRFTYASPYYRVINKMRDNVYAFSAAKQYQQVRTMSRFIDDRGVKSTFKEFRALAGQVFEDYNKAYLRTEWVTAIGQSQMAKEWVEADQKKDIIPYLEYRTQRDARVRDEHAILDGITLPVEHPFWRLNMPKNGWNCRCFTVSHEQAKVTDLSKRDLSELSDETKFPKVFRMNPGIDGLIFNPKFHPYFRVAKGDAGLKANNFNLPKP